MLPPEPDLTNFLGTIRERYRLEIIATSKLKNEACVIDGVGLPMSESC
jgi:hypothetical protein